MRPKDISLVRGDVAYKLFVFKFTELLARHCEVVDVHVL